MPNPTIADAPCRAVSVSLLLLFLAFLASPGVAWGQSPAGMPYPVPDEKRVRVLISTDAANECDDQFAIAHALLTPQFILKGIIAAHFGARSPGSMEKSYAEMVNVIDLMGMKDQVPALKGSATPMTSEKEPAMSPGAQLIVREAMADDSHPLYVLVFGPLTDVASAYLSEPRIAKRMTVVWSGGGSYPKGNWEFNCCNDVIAANVVFGSEIEFWQVPQNVYSMMRVSMAELWLKVRPCGAIGKHLLDSMVAFNERMKNNKGWPRGEDWTLGDSPGVCLVMNPNPHTDFYDMLAPPHIAENGDYAPREETGVRKIRVYNTVNGRHVLEDMFAKLQLAYPPGK